MMIQNVLLFLLMLIRGIIVMMMTTMVMTSINISDNTAIDYDDNYYENNNVDKYNYCADDD